MQVRQHRPGLINRSSRELLCACACPPCNALAERNDAFFVSVVRFSLRATSSAATGVSPCYAQSACLPALPPLKACEALPTGSDGAHGRRERAQGSASRASSRRLLACVQMDACAACPPECLKHT